MSDTLRKHVLIVESNYLGYRALEAAKRLGHEVSFIRAGTSTYGRIPGADEILRAIDRVIDIERIGAGTEAEQALEAAISNLHRKAPIDAVLSLQDLAILPLARVAERVGLRFTDPDAVERARNKYLTSRLLQACGIPVGRARLACGPEAVRTIALELGLPVFIKPAVGFMSLMAKGVHTPEALDAFVENYTTAMHAYPQAMRDALSTDLIVEDYLAGDMVSVELGMLDGEATVFMVSDRKRAFHDDSLELGATMPACASVDDQRTAVDYAVSAVRALGLDLGVFHVELMLTADGPRLIEVNPRLMGAMMPLIYHHATGLDIYESLIEIHLGKQPNPPDPFQLRGAVTGRCLAAREAGVTRRDIDLSWLDSEPHIVYRQIQCLPEQPLSAYRTHADIFGFIQVRGASPEAAIKRADDLIERIAQSIGVSLAT